MNAKDALLQKADILYQTQDYDLALIYYSRGHKVYPRNKGFIEGMKKSEHEIGKCRKGKGKIQKLTPAGDLTYLIHKVPDPKPFKFQPKQDRQVKHLPSATFNTRPLCQLIRIHKTPSISLLRSVSVPHLDDLSDTDDMDDKRPESRLVKSTIGEFYDDKKYLEKLASRSKSSPPAWGMPLQDIANSALHFLFDRVAYWDRLGPLPPPPPPRKSKSNKLSGSTMSLNSVLTMNSTNSKTTSSEFSRFVIGKKRVPTYRRRNSQIQVKVDPSKLNFRFQSIHDDKDGRKMSKIEEEDDVPVSDYESSRVYDTTISDTPGQSVTDYVKKEIEKISEGYKLGWIQETSSSCDSCLRLLEKYSEEEVPEKHEMTAILHSYRGNCAVQNRKFDEALAHHKVDLSIGEEYDIKSARYRALGNIGRVYMLQGKHQKALETLTMKAPLCKNAKESSSLFHEIGNCFLVLSHFRYAKDAARKSLQCAEECGDKNLQLQACVLNGLADVNMKKYKNAHKSFEEALTHAQALGDKRAEEAMKHALIDVNKKMAHKLKTQTLENRTNEVSQQPVVTNDVSQQQIVGTV